MYDPARIHISHDEARSALRERWNNADLKKAIEDELGEHFMSQFSIERPRGVFFPEICTPSNGFPLFYYGAMYVGTEPLVLEFHEDIFVNCNKEKKGLGKLRVELEDGSRATINIMAFHENEKRKMGECTLKTGEKMVEFHHRLLKIYDASIELFDHSGWFKQFGRAADYYYHFLLHFVSHGVLFETFQSAEEEEYEDVFTQTVVLPAMRQIEERFGLKPLVVRLYPANQTAEEDFYWWCYPPKVNDYIVEYARKHKLTFRPWQAE